MARNYIRNTEGLKRYHEAKSNAKKYGGAYSRYVSDYYRMSRFLRKKGVQLKNIYGGKGVKVLDYHEFMTLYNSNNKTRDIIHYQFSIVERKQAEKLNKMLNPRGKRNTVRYLTKQITDSEWKIIDKRYHELKDLEGKEPANAVLLIAQEFFGSE